MFSRANINAHDIRAKLNRPRGTGRRRPSIRRRGKGFFGNLWNGIKRAASWVKSNKIISRVANAIPHPYAKAIGTAAGAVGLGRRRRSTRRRGGARMYTPTVVLRKSVGGRRKRTVRRRRGGSMSSFLSKAHKFVKSHRLASKGLRHFGFNTLARGAHALGYGKRKRRRTVRGGSIGSFLTKAHKFVKGNRLVSKGLRHFGFSNLARGAHAVGYGRKRTVRRRRK